MFDIIQLKDRITKGGIALSKPLEDRILNDQMTEADHAFIARTFSALRDIKKNGITPYEEENGV